MCVRSLIVCVSLPEVPHAALSMAAAVKATVEMRNGRRSLEITRSHYHEENTLADFNFWLGKNFVT